MPMSILANPRLGEAPLGIGRAFVESGVSRLGYYGVAVIAQLVALGSAELAPPSLDLPLILPLSAVIGVAWLGGPGPGLLALTVAVGAPGHAPDPRPETLGPAFLMSLGLVIGSLGGRQRGEKAGVTRFARPPRPFLPRFVVSTSHALKGFKVPRAAWLYADGLLGVISESTRVGNATDRGRVPKLDQPSASGFDFDGVAIGSIRSRGDERGAVLRSTVSDEAEATDTLAEVVRMVAKEVDPAKIARRVLDAAIAITGAERGVLFADGKVGRDEPFRLFIDAAKDHARIGSSRWPESDWRALHQALMCGDAPRLLTAAGPEAGASGYLALPLSPPSGCLVGGMVLARPRPGTFSPRGERVAAALAALAASALDHARLDRTLVLEHHDLEQVETQSLMLNLLCRKNLRRMEALHTIEGAMTAGLDLQPTLALILEQVRAQLGANAADILLVTNLAPPFGLELVVSRGFGRLGLEQPPARSGEILPERAASTRRRVVVAGTPADRAIHDANSLVEIEGFVGYVAVPLTIKGQVKGVLEAFFRGPIEPDPEWLGYLEVLAGQAAIAIDHSQLAEGLRRSGQELSFAYDATIEGWAGALDLRDKETEGHSRRVTDMTLRLARVMGVGPSDLTQIRRGALLHDVGKLGIPDAILLKTGPLTKGEWDVMREHPGYAHEWLSPIAFLETALDIPYCHHERWDGSGYPRGLKGEEIPFAARVFAAVDVWDAVSHDRPYRKAWPVDVVRDHILSLSGTHLDPSVVDAFMELLREIDREGGADSSETSSLDSVLSTSAR